MPRAALEALHPSQLVGELLGPNGIAVGQIYRHHADHAVAGRHQRLDPARVIIRVVAMQAALDVLQRSLG